MALNYVNYVRLALLTIAHLAGLVAAVILLLKIKNMPAILATVAFGLLSIQDIGAVMRTAFLDRLIVRQMAGRNIPWAIGGFNCCCGVLDLAAIVCLIVAVWQAVSATGGGEMAERAEAVAVVPPEEAVEQGE